MTQPVPTSFAFSSIRGRTVRFTKLDACGNPVGGAGASFVTTGFITVKQTKNMDNGNEVKVSNASDRVDVYRPGNMTLLNYNLEIDFSVADTGALAMISDAVPVLDYQSAVAGWEEKGLTSLNTWWALELWTGIAGQQCVGTAGRYGYWVYPFIGNSYVDADDITNKETNFMVKALTYQKNQWGKGPYTVVAGDSSNTPSRLLQPVSTDAHKHFEVVTIAPPAPAATAGPQALTLPTPY